MLYIFGGLPASGKTTLARQLGKSTGSVYLRIDTIEEAIQDAGEFIGPEGYEAAYRVAGDNLDNGLSVIADSVNPIQLTRRAWREVASNRRIDFLEIEIICSSKAEHRQRLESRPSRAPGKRVLTWEDVLNREYEPWEGCIVFDTVGEAPEESQLRLEKEILLAKGRL